jgi:hypothetical protein
MYIFVPLSLTIALPSKAEKNDDVRSVRSAQKADNIALDSTLRTRQ